MRRLVRAALGSEPARGRMSPISRIREVTLALASKAMSGALLKPTYDWCDRVFRVTGWIAVSALFDYLYMVTENRSVWLFSKVFDFLLLWLVINIAISIRVSHLETATGARYWVYQAGKLVVAAGLFYVLLETMLHVAQQLTLNRVLSVK